MEYKENLKILYRSKIKEKRKQFFPERKTRKCNFRDHFGSFWARNMAITYVSNAYHCEVVAISAFQKHCRIFRFSSREAKRLFWNNIGKPKTRTIGVLFVGVKNKPKNENERYFPKTKNAVYAINSAIPALEISQLLHLECLSFCSSCNFRISKGLRWIQRFFPGNTSEHKKSGLEI